MSRTPPARFPAGKRTPGTGAEDREGRTASGPASAPARKLRTFQLGEMWVSEWRKPTGKLEWRYHKTLEEAAGAR